MEQHTPSTASDALDLLDEPLFMVPSMPAMKDNYTVPKKAEEALEDWSGEFDLSESNIKVCFLFFFTTLIFLLVHRVLISAGYDPCSSAYTHSKHIFPSYKDQIWHNFAANEYEKAFHEGVAVCFRHHSLHPHHSPTTGGRREDLLSR